MPQQSIINGAWDYREGNRALTLIIADNYFSVAEYDPSAKTFISTYGGTCTIANGALAVKMEFNSKDRNAVGKTFTFPFSVRGNEMMLTQEQNRHTWKRMDDGTANLSGNWHITQREMEGKMTPVHVTGPRKTIKILSSTRFQWAAINTETGEFFGTGGGRYSFENGRYTEMIEFFSRDSSRVGVSLRFDAKLEGSDWHHSGKSSKGDPINEIWSRN